MKEKNNKSYHTDFDDDFDPVKELTEEELNNDKLVKRLKFERKFKEMEASNNSVKVSPQTEPEIPQVEPEKPQPGPENAPQKSTQTHHTAPSTSSRKRVHITGKDDFLQHASKKKSPILKMGSDISTSSTLSPNDLEKIRRTVLSQLNGHNTDYITGAPSVSDKYNDVYLMLEHTVRDGEGHSVLLIGPRSCGKSAIIKQALKRLDQQYPEDFLVIKLSAYIHSDDHIAVREIARQLDYNAQKVNELEAEARDVYKFEQRGISDTFNNIMTILDDASTKNSDKLSVAIIFIIEEFEKYTGNNKQTLLYNLFDLSQTSSIPICVVGVSTKITTRELLEKRVRSRFSQRMVTVPRPASVDEFWANAKLGLSVPIEVAQELETENGAEIWNNYIEQVYQVQGSNIKKLLYQNFYTVKNYKDFFNNCIYPVSKLSKEQPFLTDEDFAKYANFQPRNNVQDIVSNLSTLELLLVIAAARFIEKVDSQAINFNMAYQEYEEMMKILNSLNPLATSSSSIDSTILSNIRVSQKVWSSKVLRNSWETLYRLGIVLDIITNSKELNTANNNINKTFLIEDTKMVVLDITLDELGSLVDDNAMKRLTKL